jgi:hypothetical protein
VRDSKIRKNMSGLSFLKQELGNKTRRYDSRNSRLRAATRYLLVTKTSHNLARALPDAISRTVGQRSSRPIVRVIRSVRRSAGLSE